MKTKNKKKGYWTGKKRPEIKSWLGAFSYVSGHIPHNKNKKGYKNSGSFKKNHEGLIGENNPSFVHGFSNKLKGFYESRRKIKLRFGFSTLKSQEWLQLKIKYKNTCLCCGLREPEIKLTIDHITPLKNGGLDEIDNIQPLCGSCNRKKYRSVIDFRQPLK